ncbi:FxsB family cyclophane-forming radical SAM/SPASM peptide maturase [Kineosporia sp. NBRC 101731]|uniref:FxsB family cyclophane-forming radical SAM/SPASM peptide maturase n=1 Tax=Kineosporia sp. NBRC 101731 TaxID=3032199 RepID=UPI0024A2B7BE|nr:FxsB family cyclophane-forming radical SAM/SPASM peptide maturase [Kineosporia sp. NBRC 101731]GLY29881.1 hypothetical protein Kisp02_32460 [Kineosporia sp. NBRC 101731]
MPVNTFVLKVANRCNIDCDYCYVFNSADQVARTLPARMSSAVVTATTDRIREYCESQGLATVNVVFHGGEPLLLGLRRMRELLSDIRSRLAPVQVSYVLQTNGVLVDERWADLFSEYQVKVGVSLDGPPEVNDLHRRGHRGQSTAAGAAEGVRLLRQKDDVLAGVLAVIDLRADPVATYDYLADLGAPMIDFALPHATHQAPPLRTPGHAAEYGRWLCDVFDRWHTSPGRVRVRMFDDIVALRLGARGAVDSLGLAGSGMVTIESDGGIEGYDALRAVRPGESQLGLSVFENTLEDACGHPGLNDRVSGSWDDLGEVCRSCELVSICGGGYKPHRFAVGTGYLNPSVYCDDLQVLIRHVASATERRLTAISPT